MKRTFGIANPTLLRVLVTLLGTVLVGLIEVFTRAGGSVLAGAVLVTLFAGLLACWITVASDRFGQHGWFAPVLLGSGAVFYLASIDAALTRIGQWSRLAAAAAVLAGAAALAVIMGVATYRLLRPLVTHPLIRSLLALVVGFAAGLLLAIAQVGRGELWVPLVSYVAATAYLGCLLLRVYPRLLLTVALVAALAILVVLPARYTDLAAVAGWVCVCAVALLVDSAARSPGSERSPHTRGSNTILCFAGLACFVAAHFFATRAPDSWTNASGKGLLTALISLSARASDLDRDGHGFLFSATDCKPLNPAIHAGLHEQPNNGMDDNCQLGDAPGQADAWVEARININPKPAPWQGDILLIVVDTLRYDTALLPQNSSIVRLAERGVHFERAYSTSTFTALALGSLFEAKFPSHADLVFTSRLQASPAAAPGGLVPWLRSRGYDTGFVGGYGGGAIEGSISDRNFTHGARVIVALEGYPRPEEVLTRASQVWAQLNPDTPRFLYVHYFWMHRTELTRSSYTAAAREVDASIGSLVQLVGPETMIVLTADHGEEFHDHGGEHHASTLYEEVVHVPLIVARPGLAPRRVPQLTTHMAFLPTLTALLAPDSAAPRGPYLCLDQPECHNLPVPLALELPDRHLHGLIVDDHKAIRDLNTGRLEVFDLAKDPKELNPLPASGSQIANDLAQWEENWFGDKAAQKAWLRR